MLSEETQALRHKLHQSEAIRQETQETGWILYQATIGVLSQVYPGCCYRQAIKVAAPPQILKQHHEAAVALVVPLRVLFAFAYLEQ